MAHFKHGMVRRICDADATNGRGSGCGFGRGNSHCRSNGGIGAVCG